MASTISLNSAVEFLETVLRACIIIFIIIIIIVIIIIIIIIIRGRRKKGSVRKQ